MGKVSLRLSLTRGQYITSSKFYSSGHALVGWERCDQRISETGQRERNGTDLHRTLAVGSVLIAVLRLLSILCSNQACFWTIWHFRTRRPNTYLR
jgi:hypothetical protein